MKICSRCKKYLGEINFSRRKANKDGLEGVCRACRRVRRVSERYPNRDKILARTRELRFIHDYGLTLADRAKMYADQNGCCAICDEARPLNRIVVDHDHETGKVRGLLCYSCNRNLSGVEDQRFFRRALKYLGIEFITGEPR